MHSLPQIALHEDIRDLHELQSPGSAWRLRGDTTAIAISQSRETADALAGIREAMVRGADAVGSRVNLGAGTSNPDLKNTYGVIRIDLPEERRLSTEPPVL